MSTLNRTVSSPVTLFPYLSFAWMKNIAGCPLVIDICLPFTEFPVKIDDEALKSPALTFNDIGLY
jgi:hypothetical protein